MSTSPYLPTRVGVAALAELDRVDWSILHHAYGEGVVGNDLAGDVAGSLALLREDPVTAMNDGLWSNISHQGTVYEATAYALPFVSAIAAGKVSTNLRSALCTLLGDIAISGSYVAPNPSHAGSFDAGVVDLIGSTLARCDGYFTSIGEADPSFAPLVAAIRLLRSEPSTENREKVEGIIDLAD